MKALNKFKMVLGTILSILGIIIIFFAGFQLFKWKYLQNDLIEQNEILLIDSELEQDELDTDLNGQTKKNTEESISDEYKDENEDEYFSQQWKREDYERGMIILQIPMLKLSAAVMEGTSDSLLKSGPGLYEISSLPGVEGGNVCIAGHRTTYGAWFKNIDKLKQGDEIVIKCMEYKFVYKVEKVFIVDKKDWSITEPTGYSALTLTSCHPLGSAKQRIIVRGRLDQVQ